MYCDLCAHHWDKERAGTMGTVMFEDDLAISGTAESSPMVANALNPGLEARDSSCSAGRSCDSGRGAGTLPAPALEFQRTAPAQVEQRLSRLQSQSGPLFRTAGVCRNTAVSGPSRYLRQR